MSDLNNPTDRGLVWVVQFSSALSLGTLAGFLYSVKAVVPAIRFEISAASFVAFFFAAAASILLWHVVFQLTAAHEQGQPSLTLAREHLRRKRWLASLATLLAAGLVVAFIYPLKDFSSEKAAQIGLGALVALLFLGALGMIFWRVVRFLEAEGGQPGAGGR